MSEGKLIIKISSMGRKVIEEVSIRIESSSGQIGIVLGNSGTGIEFLSNSSGIYNIIAWRSSVISIGAKTTSNGTRIYADNSEIRIGEDCMFSDAILIQGSDQHAIVDIPTRHIINRHRRVIAIERHVWLGRGSTIMPDVTIGPGAIIGTASLVSKNIPGFVAAAGVPARVVREETTWARNPDSIDPETHALISERAAVARGFGGNSE